MTDFVPLDVVERFDHVAIAVWDVGTMVTLVELLGGRFRDGGDVESAGFKWVQFHLPGAGKLEVLQPLDADDSDHFLVRFLEDRGEGLHHLTFKVTDLEAAVAEARSRGFEVVGVDTSGAWKEAFLHPASTRGVLIQLAEWDDADPPEPRASLADVL
ncbi:MAG: VOC family protein [Acidimicrobiia bacterium]|nr:VOC family protein [Acidimicrobiia bacterium]